MTRSIFSRALTFVSVACLSVAHAFHAGYAFARSVFAGWMLLLLEEPSPRQVREWPRVTQVSPSAFRQYRAARERPTVTRCWRMCPSG